MDLQVAEGSSCEETLFLEARKKKGNFSVALQQADEGRRKWWRYLHSPNSERVLKRESWDRVLFILLTVFGVYSFC